MKSPFSDKQLRRLRQTHVCLCLPCYGGMLTESTLRGVLELANLANACGIPWNTIRYGVNTCGTVDLDAPPVLTEVPTDITLDNTEPAAFCVLLFTDGAAPSPLTLNPDCAVNVDLSRSICNIVLRASGTQARYTVRAPASANGGQVDVQGAAFNPAGRYQSLLDFSNAMRVRVAACAPQ